MKDEFNEIASSAQEGLDTTSRLITKGKLLLGGLVISGIGITQALFGWVGQGFVFRVLYPIPLILAGAFMIWGSRLQDPRLGRGAEVDRLDEGSLE